MRKIFYIAIALLIAQPAVGKNLSPIQEYLQNEAGYAPPQLAPLPSQQQGAMPTPYSVAQSRAGYAPINPQAPESNEHDQIFTGIIGMNL